MNLKSHQCVAFYHKTSSNTLQYCCLYSIALLLNKQGASSPPQATQAGGQALLRINFLLDKNIVMGIYS